MTAKLTRRTKLIETMRFHVNTTQKDIETGECRLANRCMEKVAIARRLNELDHDKNAIHHVRVDAGTIRFNYRGYRWEAKTPKVAKTALIKYDNPKTYSLVKPHEYDVVAERKSKIQKLSKERQQQINEARTARKDAGLPDKLYNRNTLRQRIVGFA